MVLRYKEVQRISVFASSIPWWRFLVLTDAAIGAARPIFGPEVAVGSDWNKRHGVIEVQLLSSGNSPS